MRSLSAALLIARNDFRRRLRDRSAILMGLVTPLVMAALIGSAFGGGIRFSATVLLVDLDGSDISRGVLDGIAAGTPDTAPLHYRRGTDLVAARGDLEAGRVDSVLVVPAGFGASVPGLAAGTPLVPLHVVVDADKRLAGDVTRAIAEGIGSRITTSVLAVSTALAVSASPPDAAAVQAMVSEAQKVTVPIAMQQVDVQGRYSPVAYFGASMGILFLFFTVGAGARSLITERKEGTLDRVRAAPVTDTAVMLGKTIGVLALGLASLVTIWLATSLAFGARWGSPAAVLAVIVAVVLAVAGISTMVTGLARTDAQVDGYSSIVAFVLALLGGSFMQPGSLPGVLQTMALLTPNGWALRALTRVGAAEGTLVDVLPAVGVLLLMAVVTTAAGIGGLRAKVAR